MPSKIEKGSSNHIVVHGTAHDAKGGAVVVTAQGKVYYIEHLDSWNNDYNGKEVEVTGIHRVKKLIPDPVVGQDGGISQGAEGNQDVLEDASWKKK